MAIMQPVINNNGETKESHVEKRIDIRNAIMETMKRLQEIAPHGRDYQTLADSQARYNTDLEIYRARFAMLDKLNNEILDEALAIQNQGK